jgi:hypothetical protein
MLGISTNATVYQKSDSPRYFEANKGLLVICVWMCVSTAPQIAYTLTDGTVCPIPRHVVLLPLEEPEQGQKVGCHVTRGARHVSEDDYGYRQQAVGLLVEYEDLVLMTSLDFRFAM